MKYKKDQSVIVIRTGKKHTIFSVVEPKPLSEKLKAAGFLPCPNEVYVLNNNCLYYDFELSETT